MGKPTKKESTEKPLGRKQRSLEREKQRSLDITRSFATLHKCLPDFVPPNLPKIKILRLAARYIEYLESILEPERVNPFSQQPMVEDFFLTATKEIMARNCYAEEIRRELEGRNSQKPESELTRLLGAPLNYPTPSPERVGSLSFSESPVHCEQISRPSLPEVSALFTQNSGVSTAAAPPPVHFQFWNTLEKLPPFGHLSPLHSAGFSSHYGNSERLQMSSSIPPMSKVISEPLQTSSQWTFHDLSTVSYNA